jgi:hypothetical protein
VSQKKPKQEKKLTREDVTSPALQKLVDAVYEFVEFYLNEGQVAVSLSVMAFDSENRIEERIILHGDKELLAGGIEEIEEVLDDQKGEYVSIEHWHYGPAGNHQDHKPFIAVLEEMKR